MMKGHFKTKGNIKNSFRNELCLDRLLGCYFYYLTFVSVSAGGCTCSSTQEKISTDIQKHVYTA